mgnify:CR=1 FL=1
MGGRCGVFSMGELDASEDRLTVGSQRLELVQRLVKEDGKPFGLPMEPTQPQQERSARKHRAPAEARTAAWRDFMRPAGHLLAFNLAVSFDH